MADSLLLVDLENAGKVDLKSIPAGIRVWFFFGAKQNKVSTEFLREARALGDRFDQIDIEGQGKNALDFHIAFYLGEHLQKSPSTACIVLSKDKGFDPLITHLGKRAFAVRRAESLAEAFASSTPSSTPAAAATAPKPASAARTAAAAKAPPPKQATPKTPPKYEDVLAWLTTIKKENRPRKRARLVAHVYTHFGKKIPEAGIQSFVDRMIAAKKLNEVNGTIGYNL